MWFTWRPVTASAGIVCAMTFLVPTSAASAADGLIGSAPGAGARLTSAPATLQLRFAAPLRRGSGHVTLAFPDGSTLTRRSTTTGSTVNAPLGATDNGSYHVSWRATSAAGQALTGGFDFSLHGQKTSTTGREGVSPASPSTVTGPSTPTTDEPGDNEPGWILGTLAFLTAALGTAWTVMRRRVRDDPR